MYRLCTVPFDGIYKEASELVSESLATMIETFFGKTDDNGNFTDLERVKNFMKESEYLSALIDEDFALGKGLLEEKIPWVELIAKRYSDMQAKIVDRKHQYTFDEMGEALLFEMINVFCNVGIDYLIYLASCSPIETIVPKDLFFERIDCKRYHKLSDLIYKKFNSYYKKEYKDEILAIHNENLSEYVIDGEIDFDDPFLDFYYYCFKSDYKYEDYFDTFIHAFSSAYIDKICDFSELLSSGIKVSPESYMDDFGLKVLGENGTKNLRTFLDYTEILFPSPIVWDWDYMFVLEMLNDKNALDSFLKTAGTYARFALDRADSLFTGSNDTCDDF